MQYKEQIERIKDKIPLACKADAGNEVFGASSHKYKIGPTLSESEISEFEKQYSISLPNCYRSFLLHVGNGGSSYFNSSAGPYYGICSLGEGIALLDVNPKKQLNKPIIVNPKTTDEEWEQIAEQLINDENISDEDYEAEQERVFAGILPIGSQGCTYLQAIALNGEHKGRVIYMDMDCHKPWFVYEDNFLDWYERWLDEIISGVLIKDSPGGFATTRKGDDKELLELYDKASNDESRIEALRGMDKLKAVSDLSSTKLLDLCTNENSEIRYLALRLLTKFNYRKAIFPLTVHLKGNQKDCLEALSYIWLYAGKCKKHWVKAVREILPKVNDEETFNFVGYIFVDTGIDFSNDFRPFASHTNPEIRTSVFYSLGKLNNKRELVDLFILGLNDDVPRVVHATLQALSGVNDERLLESYKRITDRFKTDESYILTNLLHRLKESGFRSQDDFLNKYLKG